MVDVLHNRISEALAQLTASGRCKVQQLTWPETVGVGWHQYEIHIQHRRREIVGFGTSPSEDIAIIKAFMEAIERSYLFTPANRLKNSSGLSAHVDPTKARESALNECLERDAFLCHFLTQTPFDLISDLVIAREQLPFLEYLGRSGIQLHVRSMRTAAHDRRSVVIIAEDLRSGSPRGASISAACAESLRSAFEKALLEISGSIAHYLKVQPCPNPAELQNPEDWGPLEHGNQLHDPEYWSWFKDKYLAPPEEQNSASVKPAESYRAGVATFGYQPEFCPSLEVTLAIAKIDQLQALYFGPLTKSLANFDRLSVFSGTSVSWADLEKRHHPFP
jgi:ribosomal protein S12 methylthiotransferase accessory factor YcaO